MKSIDIDPIQCNKKLWTEVSVPYIISKLAHDQEDEDLDLRLGGNLEVPRL